MVAKFKFLICCLLSLGLTPMQAQQVNQQITDALTGHWEGAFIKNNSYQKLEMKIYPEGDKLASLQVMEEWHPEFGEFVIEVKVDSTGVISFGTGLGMANVRLDQRSLEISGSIENSEPAIYLHLKKLAKPPVANYNVEEIWVTHKKDSLYGHLHTPKFGDKATAIILVGGRGCYAGLTKYNLSAKILRRYGVSVLAFHKRGTGKSTGDCSTATIEDLAAD